MTDADVAYYRDLLDGPWQGLTEAACLTYARGIDEDALISAFGGDPAEAPPRSLEDVGEELMDYHYSEVPNVLALTSVGEWLIGLEINGFQGSRPEVLRAASADGTAVSVFWNVNADNSFQYATHGRTQVGFDLGQPADQYGAEPGALDEHLTGLPLDYGPDAWAAGLALAERVTKVRLPATLLDRQFRCAFLTDVPEDLVHEGLVGNPALDDPFIRAILAEPTADKLPAITRYLAEVIARESGTADVPAIRAALDALAVGARPKPELRQSLLALAEQFQREQQTLDRVHTALGLAAALEPDAAKAAFDLHFHAGYCIHSQDDRVRLTVLYQCLHRAAG
jgi:hypothetical protein